MLSVWLLVSMMKAEAANLCPGIDVPVDKFTGKAAQSAGVTVVSDGFAVPWIFELVDGRLTLTVRVSAVGIRDEVFLAGYALPVMLKDGSIVTLVTKEATYPVAATAATVVTNWPLVFRLDKALAAQLAAQPITDMRIVTPERTMSFPVKTAYAKLLTTVLGCFGQYVEEAPIHSEPAGEGSVD